MTADESSATSDEILGQETLLAGFIAGRSPVLTMRELNG
jgi:hypothetical protein